MRRKGTIAVIDLDQCAIAIATAKDEYTVVEIDPDWRIDIGDTIEWENGEDLGFETYENMTKATNGDVFVQNHYINGEFAPAGTEAAFSKKDAERRLEKTRLWVRA